MPPGYGGLVWTALWQTTLANAAISTLAYWVNVQVNGSSFIMPFETLFMFAFIGVMSVVAASIVLFVGGLIVPEIAGWAAFIVWIAVYFGFARSSQAEMQELHKALGSASGLVYSLVAAALWWRSVGGR